MSKTEIGARLQQIEQRIDNAAASVGRDPEEIKLVAVSKTLPAETVVQAYKAGQRCFGENRVQELEDKASALPDDCEWHMIGHLQRNKVKTALEHASLIHSVDSERLLNKIERVAAEQERCVSILLEVNVAGEESKFGASAESTANLLRVALGCEHVHCKGLMTMAPFGADEDELRKVFGGLRRLRDQLQDEFQIELPELSMGMSSDFEAAIREGATMVRIGTAIFGTRH